MAVGRRTYVREKAWRELPRLPAGDLSQLCVRDASHAWAVVDGALHGLAGGAWRPVALPAGSGAIVWLGSAGGRAVARDALGRLYALDGKAVRALALPATLAGFAPTLIIEDGRSVLLVGGDRAATLGPRGLVEAPALPSAAADATWIGSAGHGATLTLVGGDGRLAVRDGAGWRVERFAPARAARAAAVAANPPARVGPAVMAGSLGGSGAGAP
jgi:hypothetical protein